MKNIHSIRTVWMFEILQALVKQATELWNKFTTVGA